MVLSEKRLSEIRELKKKGEIKRNAALSSVDPDLEGYLLGNADCN